jgi:glycosyltransferase involved in cell wall biosynthesis
MFYYIPIEPLEERYTEQWYRWFPEALKKRKVDFTVIDGEPLNKKIECGTFLDINSTLHYKAEQLKKISKLFFEKKVKSGDVFFVADLEFWGIESIRYLSVLNNIPVEIYGFMHAASYTKEDFMSKCESFGQYFENGWVRVCDKVFVGSNYHKTVIDNQRSTPYARIVVTGNPYKVSEVKQQVGKFKKKNKVILTNRPDYEKRPNLTLDVFRILHERYPSWEFVVTTSRDAWGKGWLRELALDAQNKGVLTIKEGLTKAEYLTELAESKVMTGNSIEENFGYCILEACVFDTIPIVENNYSHPELLENDERCLFTDINDQISKIENAMIKPFEVSSYANKYEKSLDKILDHCL